MRVEFVKAVQDVLRQDEKAMFITGDLGFNAFEGLRSEFGVRFFNAGAAEQNMLGVAAGLAFEGFKPWVYSIAPFVTYRCLEQIRNDVCLHNLPVRIAGNGGGYTYGIMGSTHHTLEDIAVLKALPNMRIYLPCTNNQVESCVRQIAVHEGPTYLRLGFPGVQSNRLPISENNNTLTRRYSNGQQYTIIGVGQAVQVALRALDENHISADQVSVFGVARYPLNLISDRELVEACVKSQNVIVLDEHYLHGSIAESLKYHLPNIKKFSAINPVYKLGQTYGSPQFHARESGLTVENLKAHLKD